MAASLALSRANVEGPDGALYPSAALLVRRNIITVKLNGQSDPAVYDTTVLTVERVARAQWKVTTSKGAYIVTRDKTCKPCGH